MSKRLEASRQCAFLCFLLVLIGVIGAKLDGSTEASWFAILSPLWLFDVIYLCLVGLALFSALKEREWKVALLLGSMLLGFISFVVFQLLVIFVVEGALQIPAIAVAAPLLLVCVGELVLQGIKLVADEKKPSRIRRRR